MFIEYSKAYTQIGMPLDFTEADVKQEIQTRYTTISAPSMNTIKTWIANELKKSNYKITNAGRAIEYTQGDAVTNADLHNLENYLQMVNSSANGGPGYNIGDVKATLGQILKEWENITLQDLINDIRFDKNQVNFTDAFLEQLYNYWEIQESLDIFKLMMKQWMWCVKRKVWNRPVRHHIWINFFGTTGFGKSEFVKRFTKSFEDFRCEGGLEIFADQGREYKKFCNNFILFFDELSQNNQTALADAKLTTNTLNAIKASVTGEVMDVRILGGQEQNKVKIRYTPISAANYHLYDIIYDETSMRRFFEFNVGRTQMPTESDFAHLNSILANSELAFKGIDENNEDGYFKPESDLGKEIRCIQKKYLPTKTTVNVWIKKCCVKSGKTSSDLLYNDYKNWCKEYGYNPRNLEGYNEILASRFGRNTDGEILIDLNVPTNSTSSQQTAITAPFITQEKRKKLKNISEEALKEVLDND